MPTTSEAAYTTITDEFIAGWDAGTPAIVGTVPEIRFKGLEKGAIPSGHFCRFSMLPVIEGQSSLRDGENGQRYTVQGNIIIQVFAFKGSENAAEAAEYARRLAIVARNIFRGHCFAGGIQFRNVRVQDANEEPKYIRRNVIAEYEYDEIG